MTHTDLPHGSAQRLVFLDWLRILAFGLLVLYHVGMYYVSWDWHIKSPHANSLLEPLMRASSPWRLGMLFLLSGAASSLMFRRSGATGALLAGRSKRLLAPIVFGIAVIVPPQSYFEVVSKGGYAGSYADFLALYFTAYSGFCKAPGQCLILPTWNHLWFVVYLLVYTLALWGLVRAWPTLLERLASMLLQALRGARLLALPVAVLALLRLTLYERFPPTHALVDDFYLHASYFALFVTGAALAREPVFWGRMNALRWPALSLAVVAWFVMMGAVGLLQDAATRTTWIWLPRTAVAAMQWCAIVAAIGFAQRHFHGDSALRRYLTEAVFPVYILHQTLIILLAVALAPARFSAPAEATLLVAMTFALSFAGFEIVRRIAWLRPWFGLGPQRTAPAAPRLHGAATRALRGSR